MTVNSALYIGTVLHRRVKPRSHRLKYRVFWMLLDLDEIECLARQMRLFSFERGNIFSFRQSDHGWTANESLRDQVDRLLRDAGIAIDGGPIRLLCMPRIFGYAFNPISIYFCHHRDGSLAAILYEVNNTFGERHSYLIPVADRSATVIEQSCAKELYVSPFMPMEITYDFRVAPPATAVAVTVHGRDKQGLMISASLSGRRAAFTDLNLLKLLFAMPFMTMKVVVGIHWEALKMWLKRFSLVPRPRVPGHPVTIVSPGKTEIGHVI